MHLDNRDVSGSTISTLSTQLFFFCIHMIELYRPRVQIHTHRCYFPEEVLFSMKYVIFQFKEETYWFAYVKKFGQFFKFAIRNLYHTFPLFFLLSLSLPLVCFVYFTESRECFVFFFSLNENVVFRGAKMTQKITRWKGRKIVDRCLTIPKSASCYVSNITSTKMRAALQTVRHNYQNCTFALINSLVLRIGNFFFLAFTHAAIFTETF